jgi:RNA polymerase sigma-70 factor (ECF subfamily)
LEPSTNPIDSQRALHDMNTTSVTLLERLQRPTDPDAWGRFVALYTPLIFHWARRAGLRTEDAADLVQDVFTVLVQKMPEFEYDQHKSFRSWLRTITLNKWRDRQRQLAARPQEVNSVPLADLSTSEPEDLFEETEYRRQLVHRVLELLEAEFQPATWKAFREHAIEGRSAPEVSTELGLSVGAVYAAKFRVLARLRECLRDLPG